jgi:hypothetical protein
MKKIKAARSLPTLSQIKESVEVDLQYIHIDPSHKKVLTMILALIDGSEKLQRRVQELEGMIYR